MDLKHTLRVLRERWRWLFGSLVLCLGAASAMAFTATPMYVSHTTLFVSTSDNSPDVTQAYQGGLLAQQRVKSYADVISSPDLAEAVVADLGLHETAASLQSRITASAPLDTVLVSVAVKDRDPAQAQAIAAAVGGQFITTVRDLETPEGQTVSPVKVSTVQRATLPGSPVSPRKTLDLALGLVLGLGLGAGLAFLRDALDHSIAGRDDAAKAAGAPALGVIGEDSQAKTRPLIVLDDQFSTRSEAFRQLRSNISYLGIDRELRTLVVSSAVPAEGKTTTTANLAIALAQTGMRVILVDADLRRPQVADVFGMVAAVGLTDVLLGRMTLADTVQLWREDLPLCILPSGPIPPNPSELLGSQRMRDLLEQLKGEADIVLFDGPPLLPVTDAAVLGRIVDGALLVTRAGRTKVEQLSQAAESLRAVGANVLGVVLNRKPRHGRGSAYGSYEAYTYAPKGRQHRKLRGGRGGRGVQGQPVPAQRDQTSDRPTVQV